MSNNILSKFSLSYYSLITQIIIINIITAAIGLIFVGVFNIYLLNNNNIENTINQINVQINDITNYLEKAAILRTHVINETTNEVFLTNEPHLDPFRSQEYIESKYTNERQEIRIFDNNLEKFVDTLELYNPEIVVEVDVIEVQKKINILQKYKNIYFYLYNYLQIKFNKSKLINDINIKKNEVTILQDTIKNKNKITEFFIDQNDSLFVNIVNPIIQNDNVYGVVIIKRLLSNNNEISANASFVMWNLYLIIIFVMFLLSIFFTKSVINPIKILSSLVMFEQDRFYFLPKNLNYPSRNDEIGRLSKDIEHMSKELKLRINELENFAADVAHELKNPLANLKTSNELLLENKIKLKNKKLLFVNINKDLDRMNRLISDISEYTRTQAEVEKQKFEQFDLIEFIKHLGLSFSQNKKEIKIFFELNDSKVIVQANKDKLAQVFINLIENCFSFSPKNSNIIIQQFIKNDKIIIYIADQGIGIDQSLKNKIFERFYTDRYQKNEYHTGLGLSISKKIMESFAGSLELSAIKIERYNGACFKLQLPLKGTVNV